MKPNITLAGFSGIMIKASLVIALLLGAMAISLKAVERAKDPLREGIEKYLSEASGQMVKIDALEHVTFLPDVRFHIKNALFRNPADENDIRAQITDLDFSMPLTAIIFGQGKVEKLSAMDLSADAGIWLPGKIKINTIKLTDGGDAGLPAMEASGEYDSRSMTLYLEVDAQQKSGKRTFFSMKPMAPLSLTLGNIVLAGQYGDEDGRPVLIEATLSGNGRNYGPEALFLDTDPSILSCLLTPGQPKTLSDEHPCTAFFKPRT
jgi:hypothetical protein